MKVGKGKQPALYCSNGCTAEQLSDIAKTALGTAWSPPPPVDEQSVAQARIAKQTAALRLGNGSEPCIGTAAARYLASRALPDLVHSAALRFRGDCWHAERSKHRAMIALVQDVAGSPLAVHRTYLTRQGAKANVNPVKASLGPLWTGAIRLQAAQDEVLIGEGIETAASAGVLLGLPAWAALSAGNMAAALILPPDIRTVTIAADADGPGRKAALDGAARWRKEGRTVRIATPDKPGQDFNDILRERSNA
jgi:phage/plasmid primase-like uncharacterized protein